MSGLDLLEAVDALKAQLVSNLVRETNVYRVPVPSPVAPSITIELVSIDYFDTFGENGYATLHLDLAIDPGVGDVESESIRVYDYLGTGVTQGSSVLDAVMADQSLGLSNCVAFMPPDRDLSYDVDTRIARLPLDLTIKKVGAVV